MNRMIASCGYVLLAAFLPPFAFAAGDARNVALHRSYETVPAANYAGCKDPGDAVQLTDGETAGCDWLRASTVGWGKTGKSTTVLIDLGSALPIAAVRLHTNGGGRAGVFYPGFVGVFVSDDNTQFHLVGATDSLGIEQSRADSVNVRPLPRIVEIDNLRTRGRWVLLLLEPDGDYLFLDEVEVLQGAHDPASVVFETDNRVTLAAVTDSLPILRERAIARHTLDRFAASLPPSTSPITSSSIETLRLQLATSAMHRPETWRNLQSAIERERARDWNARGGKQLPWQIANPMSPLSVADSPRDRNPTANDTDRLEIFLWQGEYESAAITLFNATEKTLHVRPVLTPLQGDDGATISAANVVSLRTTVFVDARGTAGRTADALIRTPINGFDILPGQPRQLWLTVHAPSLPPGTYAFAMDLQATDPFGAAVSTDLVQARLTVAPLRFPDRPSLKTFAYHYIERSDITKTVQAEAIADLRAHYINVDVLFWSSALPMPTIDRTGTMQIDFTKHDAALDRYAGGELLLFYWGLGNKRTDVPGLRTTNGPPYKTAVKEWVTRWVAHLKERGLDYDDFAMYPFDETLRPEFADLAKFLKEEVDPKVRIFANSRGIKDSEQLNRIAPSIDIWCPRDLVYGARLGLAEQAARRTIPETWSYDCDRPSKGKPPLAYFRLQMWRAFDRGDRGCGLWTYADPNANTADAWDDFAWLSGRYGVVYGPTGKPADVELSGESIVPSRRWEAWREGVEDYEYLTQLRDAVITARGEGRFDAADRAAATLEGAVRDVLQNQSDPEVVYRARQDLTRAILQLRTP